MTYGLSHGLRTRVRHLADKTCCLQPHGPQVILVGTEGQLFDGDPERPAQSGDVVRPDVSAPYLKVSHCVGGPSQTLSQVGLPPLPPSALSANVGRDDMPKRRHITKDRHAVGMTQVDPVADVATGMRRGRSHVKPRYVVR